MEQNQNIVARGLRGLFSGLKTGLLMMSIFALVSAGIATAGGWGPIAAAATYMGGLSAALPSAVFGLIVTSLFGAANQIITGGQHEAAPKQIIPVVVRARAPSQGVVPVMMQQAQAPEQSAQQSTWTERVGRRNTNISDIIADNSMSDKSRAHAILEARAAAQSTEANR